MAIYSDPDSSETEELQFITSEDLKRKTKARQIKVMRLWFLENYDLGNPLDISAAVNIRDALLNEFRDISINEAIAELAVDLEKRSPHWVRRPESEMEDFYEIDAALELREERPLDAVRIRLAKFKRLLEQKDRIEEDLHEFQRMMIFTFCITTMESYLSDVFVRKVMSDADCKEKFLSADDVLSNEKLKLSDIFKRQKNLDAEIKKRLTDITFHNLPNVSALYGKVIGIQLNNLIRPIISSVEKRHDFIHRGGRDKEGNPVTTTVDEIRTLIDQVDHLCAYIDAWFAFKPIASNSSL